MISFKRHPITATLLKRWLRKLNLVALLKPYLFYALNQRRSVTAGAWMAIGTEVERFFSKLELVRPYWRYVGRAFCKLKSRRLASRLMIKTHSSPKPKWSLGSQFNSYLTAPS